MVGMIFVAKFGCVVHLLSCERGHASLVKPTMAGLSDNRVSFEGSAFTVFFKCLQLKIIHQSDIPRGGMFCYSSDCLCELHVRLSSCFLLSRLFSVVNCTCMLTSH